MTQFTDMQQRVYDVLKANENEDVPIYKLYEAAYQTSVHRMQKGQLILGITSRTMQQRLGTLFAGIRRKLDGATLAPGQAKQTYRLSTEAE